MNWFWERAFKLWQKVQVSLHNIQGYTSYKRHELIKSSHSKARPEPQWGLEDRSCLFRDSSKPRAVYNSREWVPWEGQTWASVKAKSLSISSPEPKFSEILNTDVYRPATAKGATAIESRRPRAQDFHRGHTPRWGSCTLLTTGMTVFVLHMNVIY